MTDYVYKCHHNSIVIIVSNFQLKCSRLYRSVLNAKIIAKDVLLLSFVIGPDIKQRLIKLQYLKKQNSFILRVCLLSKA